MTAAAKRPKPSEIGPDTPGQTSETVRNSRPNPSETVRLVRLRASEIVRNPFRGSVDSDGSDARCNRRTGPMADFEIMGTDDPRHGGPAKFSHGRFNRTGFDLARPPA